MKRKNNLYDKVISLDNLLLADKKARRGKGSSYGVRKHDMQRDRNILLLHEMLKNRTYKTSLYHKFSIETANGKVREISRLPYFPDRICHHAVMNIMEDIWVSIFVRDTYSCIKNRGIHDAVRRLKNDLKMDLLGSQYCLKLDIRKFYPSINHDILKVIIRRKVKDSNLLWLLDEIIDSSEGVPIGNYLSQFFANLYLAYFDHFVKQVLKVKYHRYADDMIILSNSKEILHDVFARIKLYLNENLKLEIKGNYQIFPVKTGIDFVGYRFYHTHTLLRKSIKQRYARRVAKLRKLMLNEEQYRRGVCSWTGWAKFCNSKNLIKKLQYESKFGVEKI